MIPTVDKKNGKKKILFICTHNSARSQMAEGLMKTLFGDYYEVHSAGTAPTSVNPYAIRVMEEIGIDISSSRSKNMREFMDTQFDYVITVCDRAKESCPYFPGGTLIHKGFKDPSELSGGEEEILNEFRKSREGIKTWLTEIFKPESN
jgi:arsenate reductase